jgi:uncharacterized protein YdeI (BOF family)
LPEEIQMKPLIMPLMITLFVGVPAGAQRVDPYAQPNNAWINIDGVVESVTADAFVLSYGSGTITVEMDDGDRDADGYLLVKGDKVRVSGKVDADLFQATTIEASSVYVENLGTWFYASAADEEDPNYGVPYPGPVMVAETIVQGTVTDVGEGKFTLSTGMLSITVNVDSMTYDPLDTEGYQRVRVGDQVSVAGRLDTKFFEQRELMANRIVTLSRK